MESGLSPDFSHEVEGPLIEGRDFTWENGLMVMTASYLRRRGYCCENGCRHCPYGRHPHAESDAPSKEA